MIIGVSGVSRSGKDTIASFLVENYGYEKRSFADPIKEALYRLNPDVTVNNLKGSKLRTAVDIFGWEEIKDTVPEVRPLLQKMGTEVGREMFGQDFWVNQALKDLDKGSKVVIADVRHPNEADAIRKLGGKIVRVERIGFGPANDHESENAITNYKFDITINNDSSIEHLKATIKLKLELENR